MITFYLPSGENHRRGLLKVHLLRGEWSSGMQIIAEFMIKIAVLTIKYDHHNNKRNNNYNFTKRSVQSRAYRSGRGDNGREFIYDSHK